MDGGRKRKRINSHARNQQNGNHENAQTQRQNPENRLEKNNQKLSNHYVTFMIA